MKNDNDYIKQAINSIDCPSKLSVKDTLLSAEYYYFPYSDPSYITAGYPSKMRGSDVNDQYLQEK